MIYQTQNQSLRPITTAHLAQTMALLELSSLELRQKIENEIASNPALEIVDEHFCPVCHRRLATPGLCPVCNRVSQAKNEEPIIFVSPYLDFNGKGERSDDDFSGDDWVALPEDLPSFVLRQIAPELAVEDRPIAAHILTSLDEDGLLRSSTLEIARYHHVSLSRVDHVIRLIQHAEPIGVGSCSPRDALLIQLEILAESQKIPEKARDAILSGMDLLSRRAYYELGRLLHLSSTQAQKLANFISDNLNPYPARAHWGEGKNSPGIEPVYGTPDIIISCLDDSPESTMVVEILSPYSGMLRVNPLFREIFTTDVVNQATPDQCDQWKTHLDQASLLVKCIQQRDHTIVRLMGQIVNLQRQFILFGDAHIVPITRANIAEILELHESTVSRAVAGKAVQLPNKRIIPLSKMFDRSLHVRTALRKIIDNETDPLSDTEIAEILLKQGYPVARRTVAKYRSMEGILPARLRGNPANCASSYQTL